MPVQTNCAAFKGRREPRRRLRRMPEPNRVDRAPPWLPSHQIFRPQNCGAVAHTLPVTGRVRTLCGTSGHRQKSVRPWDYRSPSDKIPLAQAADRRQRFKEIIERAKERRALPVTNKELSVLEDLSMAQRHRGTFANRETKRGRDLAPTRGGGAFDRPRLVDVAARDLGIDRVEIRRRNFILCDALSASNPGHAAI